MAKLINVPLIYTEITIGNGTDDPFRKVIQYFTPVGTLVFEYDRHTDEVSMAGNMLVYLSSITNSKEE